MHRFVPRTCTYITLLRDPVDRVVSHYYYVLQNPNHVLYKEVSGRKMSLEAYVTSGITTEVDNDQVRMLAGVGDKVDFGQCDHVLFEKALEHIEKYFSVVGFTDRFDETLLIMMRKLNWAKWPIYTRQNVSHSRPRGDDIPAGTCRLIKKQNALDYELYEYARKRFERDVTSIDTMELERFHRFQSIYYPYGKMQSTIRSVWRTFKSVG